MKAINNELLNKLIEIDSVSGDERDLSLALRSEYEKWADEIVYDNLGSIYAVKKSNKKDAPRVMVTGHMDESGFIIKKFNENGTLKALTLGNIEPYSLLGAAIHVKTREGSKISGTLVAYDENGKVLDDKKEVIVDCGFENEQMAKESGINLGDRASFSTPLCVSSDENRIFAKNWDGRYAPLLGIDLLEAVKDTDLDYDLYVGCTVQEQVGYRGIQTATNVVKPDLGIVLDTDKAFDYQYKVKEKIGELGKGLLINFYDTTVLPNRMLISSLKKVCQENNIAHQYYYSMEGSDAAWINKLRTGTPTLFINIPIRNMNTPSSILDLRDYQSAKSALLLFIKELTPDKIQAFKEENR